LLQAPLRVAVEVGVWVGLLLVVLGVRPPGEGQPAYSAARAACCTLFVYCALYLWLPSKAAWGASCSFSFTVFEHYGPYLSRLISGGWWIAKLIALSLGAGALRGAIAWAWRRRRPRRLVFLLVEAALLGLPFVLAVSAFSDGACYWLQETLPTPPLLSFETTLAGTAFVGATAVTLALRLQLSEPPEAEWDGAPVVVGAPAGGWGRLRSH